jgi:hypothetical protein
MMSGSSFRKSSRLFLAVRVSAISLVLAVAESGCVSSSPITTAATQHASASPAALKISGPIPVGTPVVLYWRDVSPDGLYAASWTGALYKVPTIDFAPGSLAVQSPDGSRLAIGDRVYDTTSGANTQLPFDGNTAYVSVTWADDSRHVCLTRPLPGEGSASEVSFALPGSPTRVLGKFGSHGQQVPGATILACSAASNRVIVANLGGLNDTSDVWVLDTATGAIGYHRSYATTTKTNGNIGVFVVASPNGQYLAETDAATGSATIRRITDDSVVARLSGMEVHGFSWHGDLVLAAPRAPDFSIVNSSMIDPVVIDWRTSTTLWHSPAGAGFGGRLAAQPGGKAIALDLWAGHHYGIWVVGPDGLGRTVDEDIQFLVTVLVGLV